MKCTVIAKSGTSLERETRRRMAITLFVMLALLHLFRKSLPEGSPETPQSLATKTTPKGTRKKLH